jgi:hypothetical protein
MLDRKRMMGALDEAFNEQMRRLFGVLASSTDIAEAAPRFAHDLAEVCAAYEKAAAAIAAMAPIEPHEPVYQLDGTV